MPYIGTPPAGISHGKSVKNPATYEALVREGHSKSSAAAISNAALHKSGHKGRHRSKRGKKRQRSHF